MNINMGRLSRIPKMQMAFFLSLIAVSALVNQFNFRSLFTLIIAIAAVVGFDFLFLKLRKIKPFLLSAAIVTGLIIGLLISPFLPWYEVVLASFLAVVSKQFIRLNKRLIFNPAGFGLFMTSIFFGREVSWWGASLFSIFIFLPALVSIIKMRRGGSVISFFIVYYIFQVFLHFRIAGIKSFLDPTVLFFAFVMLPEPMTSPHKLLHQIRNGALVAAVSVWVAHPFLTSRFALLLHIPDPLIFGLLFGNLLLLKYK